MLKINHRPQTTLSKIGDIVMLPLMYALQGTFKEVPQRTHRWNNIKYSADEISSLQGEMMVTERTDQTARQRWLGILPIFHMPIIGGWREFVVLEPAIKQDVWFVGWVAGDIIGISQVSLHNKVRVLRGPTIVQFFGINEHGEQIQIRNVGEGILGHSGQYRSIPLL